MNLYDLGKQYIAGNEHPKIELNNNVSDWYVANRGRCQPPKRSHYTKEYINTLLLLNLRICELQARYFSAG